MKRIVILLSCVLLSVAVTFGQTKDKKELRKNTTMKVWKTPVKGRKIEEIEYTSAGMRARCTYEYDEKGRVVREVVYDNKNKPYRIHKIEYNADGTKKRQLNYNAKGNLLSVKEYEYIRK